MGQICSYGKNRHNLIKQIFVAKLSLPVCDVGWKVDRDLAFAGVYPFPSKTNGCVSPFLRMANWSVKYI